MIATQLIATHNATMECYRRAMIAEQTLEGRRENLNQANKLARTYAKNRVSRGRSLLVKPSSPDLDQRSEVSWFPPLQDL
jgi:hypothetical protein